MMILTKIQTIRNEILCSDPKSYNTDWFGNFLVSGLLDWYDLTSADEIKEFVEQWFSFHLKQDQTLTDEEFYQQADAPRSRLLRDYTLPLTTYAGYFGISHVCDKYYRQTGDEMAKQVCLDVGDIILHRCARNNLGLVAHDDNEKPFTIPDVAYFVVPPLFIAADMGSADSAALRRQAKFQIRGFAELFFDRQSKLTKTIYRGNALGETYWIRASGWLLWTIVESFHILIREILCMQNCVRC